MSLTVVTNLQDLSQLLAAQLTYSAREWLTLSAAGFVPHAGLNTLAARIPESDVPVGELGLLPLQYRVLFSARAFY